MKDKTNTSGSTLHGICRTFIYKFSEMMIEKHNDIQSIVELPFNLISEEYVSYLSHHGYKLTHRLGSKSHLTADMNYKTYYAKADSIYYFQKYYRYVEDFYYPNTTPEREKDTWDIRKLGIPYNVLPARPRYTINYGKITQNWLKERVKEYNYIRIPKQSISTVLDDMKAFSLFSEFLSVSYHKIQKMNDIDRRLIKIYINFVRSKAYETTTFNRRISAIKTFLELRNALGLEGFPQKELFKKTDFVKRRRKMPVPFSDNELKQMNKNINKLSIQIRNIFFIIERLGMRMSDICSAKITVNGNYCLKKVDDNNYLFTHYQFKTHKTNTLSIDGVLAGVIEGSIEASREQYGHGVNYIFSKNIEEPIGEETFTYHLNKMCKENNILSDDGKLLRIKGHTFRRTMATDYANMGVDLNVIKILLGQSKIDVLGYYIKIHGDEMNRFMVDILKEDEELIDNIGNLPDPLIEAKMEGDYLPLSCGYCSKDIKTGICDHANKCYKCTMFVPMKSKLNLYKKQLSNVETNILVCKINGYERLLSINEELKESLEDIVYQLERGTYEKDGKNCRVIS